MNLKEEATKIGLATIRRHIFLCCDQTKPKCCDKERSLESWEFLKRRLKELGLAGPQATVARTKASVPGSAAACKRAWRSNGLSESMNPSCLARSWLASSRVRKRSEK